MEDRIKEIINKWLEDTFSNKNAIPSLLVSGIASEIDKHRWEIYRFVKEEYDLEDIEAICISRKIKLTEDEESIVLHRYNDCEYQDMDTLAIIIDEVIEERK